MAVRKPFDIDIHKQNDPRARAAVLAHLHGMGFYAIENDDIYGPDILMFIGYKPKHYIEVEIKHTWKARQDTFPFSTIQLPERKSKFLKTRNSIEFWILREDLKLAIVIPDTSIVGKKPVEVPNKYVPAGEMFYQIPIEECELIELELEGDEYDSPV